MTLLKSDFNIQMQSMQPYTLVDGATGTTRYIGVSQSFGDVNASIWQIRKEWVAGNICHSGYPIGSQEFCFAWSGRTGYLYQ